MADDPPLPEFPAYTAAFGRIMRGLRGVEPQTLVSARQPEVSDLTKVTDAELVLLRRLAVDAHVYAAGAVEIEIARRSIVATRQSTMAITRLENSIEQLQGATEAASISTAHALSQLQSGIVTLSTATDKWSRRLTGLTIGIFALTGMLVVLTVVLVILAYSQRHG